MTTVTLSPESAGSQWVQGPVTVTMDAFDSECIPQIWYRLDGGDLIPYQAPFNITKEGDTLLEYQSADLSGNMETARSLHVRIDSQIPHVTHDAVASYVGTAVVNLTAHDVGQGVGRFDVRLDNESTQTVSSVSVTLSTTTPGSHVVHYYVEDDAKRSSSGSVSFFVQPVVTRTVNLTVAPIELTYPRPVSLVAKATNPETTTAAFWRRRRVTYATWGSWDLVGTATSTNGQFGFLDLPAYGYQYKAVVGSAESSPVLVTVHTPLGKPVASATRVKVGRVLRLWGTIRPRHGAATTEIKYRLFFQRYNTRTRRWVSATPTVLSINPANDINSDTSKWLFNLKTRTNLIGSWRVRFYHECPRHKASYSPWTSFAVVR